MNLQGDSFYLTNINIPEDIYVTDLYVDKSGIDLWIASYSHGLIRYSQDTAHYYLKEGTVPHSRILVLFGLSQGELLISTTRDLYLYDPRRKDISKLDLTFGSYEPSPLILSINEDRAGHIGSARRARDCINGTGLQTATSML